MTNPASPLLIPPALPQLLAAPERTQPLQQSREAAASMGLPGRERQARAFGRALASLEAEDEQDVLDISEQDSDVAPVLEETTPEALIAQLIISQQSDLVGKLSHSCDLAFRISTRPHAHGRLVLQHQPDAKGAAPPEQNVWSVALDLEVEELGLVQIRLMLLKLQVIGTLTFADEDSAALAQAQLYRLEERLTAGGKLTRPVLRVRVRTEGLPEGRAGSLSVGADMSPGECPRTGLEALGEIIKFLLTLKEQK